MLSKFTWNGAVMIEETIDYPNLISVNGQSYSCIDPRINNSKGDIIDLGCCNWLYNWNWFQFLSKRVVGVDPFEVHIPSGFELFRGIIGNCDGSILMFNEGSASSVFNYSQSIIELPMLSFERPSAIELPMLSFDSFAARYKIDEISLLKININGFEYPFLMSLTEKWYDCIDQILVCFHDSVSISPLSRPFPLRATNVVVDYLTKWYDYILVDPQLRWFLFLKR